jgi:hypothetical protein
LGKEGLDLGFRLIFDVSRNVKGGFILIILYDLFALIIRNKASVLRLAVVEIYDLLGYYAAYGDNSIMSECLSPRHGASSGYGWRNCL